MNTVTLNHEPVSGSLTDADGMIVGTWSGAINSVADRMQVNDVIKLKEAGFEVEEIAALVRKEII